MRLQATQLLLLLGAAVVIVVERHIEHSAQARVAGSMAAARLPATRPSNAAIPGTLRQRLMPRW
jgi:hypothetical protein